MNTYGFVYDYLFQTIQRKGYPPTLPEVAAACGLDETQLMEALNQLEQEGRISRSPGKARSLRITALDWHWYREAQITRFIQTYRQEHPVTPSVFEIAQACGLSLTAVQDYLAHLPSETITQTISDTSLLATA